MRYLALILLCALLAAEDATATTLPMVDLGPVEPAAGGPWSVRLGGNVAPFTDAVGADGWRTLRLKDNARRDDNWLVQTREVSPDAAWTASAGVQVGFSLKAEARNWMRVDAVTAEGVTFSQQPRNDVFRTGRQDRLFPWRDFHAADGTIVEVGRIRRLSVIFFVGEELVGPRNALSVDTVRLYAPAGAVRGISCALSSAVHGLYGNGSVVRAVFSRGGAAPAEASRVRISLHDIDRQVIRSDELASLPAGSGQTVDYGTLTPGFYELRAHWLRSDGSAFQPQSSLDTSGSMLPGIVTFAVTPLPVNDSRRRLQALPQERRYIGLHVDFLGVQDVLGLGWHNEYWKWDWKEGEGKSPRQDGLASWVGAEITREAPRPDHWLHLINLHGNHRQFVPRWAKATDGALPFASWQDWEDHLRDSVALERHRYPHQRRRIYDPGWEINLNSMPAVVVPRMGVADIVEFYRRSASVIRAADPEAMIAGPCSNTLVDSTAWFESLFQAGILDHLDAINTHLYLTPPPEHAGISAGVAKLQELLARYAPGRHLPIYGSEIGFESQEGAENDVWLQARMHTRSAILYIGAGLSAYFPFLHIDVGGASYGLFFNHSADGGWNPVRISPKPAAVAMAVCAERIEGLAPIGDLRFLGQSVWGYAFADDRGTCRLAIWSPDGRRRLALPVGAGRTASCTDMVGRRSSPVVKDGMVDVEIGESPIYVDGVDAELYAAPGRHVADLPVTSGVRVDAAAPGLGGIVATCGPGRVQAGPAMLRYAGPDGLNTAPTVVRVRLGDAVRTWWFIPRPGLRVVGLSPLHDAAGRAGLLRIANDSQRDVLATVEDAGGGLMRVGIPAAATSEVRLPVVLDQDEAITQAKHLVLRVRGDDGSDLNEHRVLTFLGAPLLVDGWPVAMPAGFAASLATQPGSGDAVEASWRYDAAGLRLLIVVRDAVHLPLPPGSATWMGDSVQIGFDTAPDEEAVYNPMAGRYNKKWTEICVSALPDGHAAVWRHRSHAPDLLVQGEATAGFPDCRVGRDTAAGTTRYDLHIPWAQLGFDAPPQPGSQLGLAILVNDIDVADGPRSFTELFSGIAKGKDWRRYGRILLLP